MLAACLDPAKFTTTVYERNAAAGRKFLVAGDGGFNLTHSELPSEFIKRYSPSGFLETAFNHFSNRDFISWINALGIKTFTGSSGRVFPEKGIKPVEVLDAFLSLIRKNNVAIKYRHQWKGFNDDALIFEHREQSVKIKSDIVVFCLGGASWPVTGSKGEWLDYFQRKGIQVKPFAASNCAFRINWEPAFINKFEGKALKNIIVSCGAKYNAGEVVLTKFGIEGSGIYPLSPQIREQLTHNESATISIDLKPAFALEAVVKKLRDSKQKVSEALKRELGLNTLQVQLLKANTSKEDFTQPLKLAQHVKNLQLKISGTAPVEDAISTVGGIDLAEINSNFELEKLRRHYVIGEMLDYDAPTGGYLLQSCFSMGKFLADYLNTST